MVTGWIAHSGPVATGELANLLHVESSEIDKALLRLEASGSVLRGNFTGATAHATEWCDRRLLARIHRHHGGNAAQAGGAGEPRAVHALAPALAARSRPRRKCWASAARSKFFSRCRDTRPRRMPGSGRFWRAASRSTTRKCSTTFPSPARSAGAACLRIPLRLIPPGPERRRVVPTSVAPITFFVREDADWMISRREPGAEENAGSQPHGH